MRALVAHWRKVRPELPEADIIAAVEDIYANDKLWRNDRYQVSVRRFEGGPDGAAIVHLSVRRLDRAAVRDWRDMQRIKNQLLGPECEAVELYPAESRLVDSANQFHLWGVDDPAYRWPIGFDAGRFVDDGEVLNTRQRPNAEKA